MGRGLSDLQKWILVKARDNRLKYREHARQDHARLAAAGFRVESPFHFRDIWPHEVLYGYYMFDDEAGWDRDCRAHRFPREAIGAKKYDAAKVATVRAFVRLAERALMKPVIPGRGGWAGGHALTDEGWRVAETLGIQLCPTELASEQAEPMTPEGMADMESRLARLAEGRYNLPHRKNAEWNLESARRRLAWQQDNGYQLKENADG